MEKIHSVLLVDDDPVANFIHEDIISTLQISDEIKIASNGFEALELVKSACLTDSCPQLILLDLNMPVMDGFEFLENFRKVESQLNKKVRIIVVSSSSNAKDREKAKSLNVDDFMVKPLTETKIKEWLDNYFKGL